MADFKDRIKELRIENELTQDGLAQALGVSRSTIGMYETGKREADYETLELIADYFNVDINYLIGWSDERFDWEQIANENAICPPNDFDGDPEDWYKMKTTPPGEGIQLNLPEIELIEKYRLLDPPGQKHINTMLDWESQRISALMEKINHIAKLEQQSKITQLPDRSYLEPMAAHERTDQELTDEMNQEDHNIMTSDDEWK